jgi:hypothetical protein
MLAIGVLALIGRSLFRKAKALLVETSTAADRLGAVSQELQALQELAERDRDPAVFTPASQLRQEQILNARRRDGKHSAGQSGQKPQPGRRSTQPPGQRVR